jgi:hypothetical protein
MKQVEACSDHQCHEIAAGAGQATAAAAAVVNELT